MGKSSSRPKAPDPYQTAQAQFQYGNTNIIGPTGGMTWGTMGPDGQFVADPNAVRYTARIDESDNQRAIREGRESGAINLINQLTSAGLPDRAQIRDTSDIAKNTFDQFMFMQAPQRQQEDRRMMQYLSDRGLPMTSGAGGQVMDDQSRRRAESDAQIMRASLDRAGSEQSRMYGLESSQRQNAMNELIAAITGVNPSPNNNQAPNSTGVNMGNLIQQGYQNDLAAWQQQQNQQNGLLGTVANLGMTVLSDRNLKTDVSPRESILDKLSSLEIFTWRYLNDDVRHIGPMAQDFQRTFGVGDGKTIALVDVAGVVLSAVQELIHELRGRNVPSNTI